ncbi:hypothetical protein Tco_1477061 [Tanacetum coccineum]
MTTLVEHMIVADAENRPPMLDKSMYNSWHSRMWLYIKGKKNGRMMLESIENGPLVYPTIEEDGLPPDVYSLVNHYKAVKYIWDKVKLLMQGTKLSYQERECKLYNNEFDKFTSVNGESLYEYYLHFAQLINDMHTIGMTMQQVQLAKNMYNTNYDQLYAYLSQHEGHANEARMLRERYPDPLALVANYQTQSNSAQYPQQLSSTPQPTHSSQPYLSTYEAPHHPQQYQHPFRPNSIIHHHQFLKMHIIPLHFHNNHKLSSPNLTQDLLFQKIAKPLTKLTQKAKEFVWGEEQEETFQTLKHRLCNAPILALPEET